MYWFLFSGLIFLAILIYLIDRQFISPAMILCVMWLICSFIAHHFEAQWGIGVSFNAVMVILTAILVFFIAQTVSGAFVQKYISNRSHNSLYTNTRENRVVISKNTNRVLLVFMGITVILVFIYELKYSISMGNTAGISLMLKYVRAASGSVLPSVLSMAHRICEGIGIFYVFVICYNFIYAKKDYIRFLPGLLIHIIDGWLSGGRTWMIYLVVELVMYSIILYKHRTNWNRKHDMKIVVVSFSIFIVFLYLFPRLGTLIGKGVNRDPWELIGYYAGSSVALFSEWLDGFRGVNNEFFGEHTLEGIYNFLRMIGFDSPMINSHYESVYIPHFYSNIFSALRRYIEDYGFVGMYIIHFLLGCLYGGAYYVIKYTRNRDTLLLLFVALFFPIAEHPIEERVLSKILTMSEFFTIFTLIVLYRFLVKKHIKMKSNAIIP